MGPYFRRDDAERSLGQNGHRSRYFNEIASPLRSPFAIGPTWRPDSFSTALFRLDSQDEVGMYE
jgi:hypothetical protein